MYPPPPPRSLNSLRIFEAENPQIILIFFKDVNNIESIQRRAARLVCGDYYRISSVTSKARDLDWSSLQSRRMVHNLTLFYKINSGAVIIPSPPPRTRSHRTQNQSQPTTSSNIHPSRIPSTGGFILSQPFSRVALFFRTALTIKRELDRVYCFNFTRVSWGNVT